MAQRLDMRFRDVAGRIVTVRVMDPREDLTQTEVEAVMQHILDKNVFASTRGDLVAKDSARIIELATTVTEWDFTP